MLVYTPNVGVHLYKDWDNTKISSRYWKGQPKYQSKNSAEVDVILLDNLLDKCYKRVQSKLKGESYGCR